MHKTNEQIKNTGIHVYLERRRSRELTGLLTRIKVDGRAFYEFVYDATYLMRGNAIPLGPEFPLTQEKFRSRRLFPSFDDRIPSRKNPAYPEYCESFGVSPNENDVLVLLATIGRKGPSSFVFEPYFGPPAVHRHIADFRRRLGLTIREFAAVFDTSTVSVQKAEQGKSPKELMKRLQIYVDFPAVALQEIKRNRAKIHEDKYEMLLERIRKERGNDRT